MSTKVKELTDQNFKEIISKGISIVDFWAEWCGPCRQQGPIIDQLAEKVGDKVNVCKLDVDSNSKIAAEYEVASIPTLLLFKDGKLVKTLVGVQPLTTLETTVAI